MKHLVVILLISIFIGGCSTPPLIQKSPKIDSYLTTLCNVPEKVPPFKTFKDVLEQKAKDNQLYAECMKKHNGLVEAIKEYGVEFNATK